MVSRECKILIKISNAKFWMFKRIKLDKIIIRNYLLANQTKIWKKSSVRKIMQFVNIILTNVKTKIHKKR